jgi:transposase
VPAGLSRRRLERVLTIDIEVKELTKQIAALVDAADTTLTQTHRLGPLVAARLLVEVVDVRRYPNRAFASANGTAPLPASSGRTVRHRFNPGGNRQLKRAIYVVAQTQIRGDTEGRAYYQRKRAAGKTHREALRCLKRRLSDLVFATMRQDADALDQAQAVDARSEPAVRDVAASGHVDGSERRILRAGRPHLDG